MNAPGKKRNLWKYFGSVTVLAMVVFGIAGYAVCSEPLDLRITAGTAGGGYYRACAAFAEYIKKDIPGSTVSVVPGGAWANLERLAAKKADIAVIENSAASLGYKGKGPSKKRYDIRMIAAHRGPNLDQFLILEETGIKTFEEIKKKKYPLRLYMTERISLPTLMTIDLLKEYGITPEDIKSWGGKVVYTSLRDMTRMIMDGLGDSYFSCSCLYPQPKYIEIGSRKRFRLLPISKEVSQKIGAQYGVPIKKLEADLYKEHNGTNEPYWSTLTILCFAVRPGLSDEVVYNITKALANHKEDLWKVHPQHKFYKPEVAWKNVGVAPLHPGAERFYKSMGYMP